MRIRFHHSQIIAILQLGKWESGVSSEDCKKHFEEVSERGSLSGSLSVQKHPSAGFQLLPSTMSHVKKTQDIIPTAQHQLTPQTVSPCLVHGDIAERRQRSMAQYNKRASQPLREFSKGGKSVCETKAWK